MELSRRNGRLGAAAVVAVVAAIVLVRLSAFGIWDPWELNPADLARDLAAGKGGEIDGPPLPPWLVAGGFKIFGVREWAGRLPMGLAGLLTVLVAYLLLARFAGRRAGIYAALVTGTTPLFLFNSRQMLGESPAFLMQALVMLTAASAVFLPTTRPDASQRQRLRATALWLAGLAAAVPLAVLAQGALLGALPPLLAVAVAAGLDGGLLDLRADRRRAVAGWIVVAVTAVVTALVVEAVAGDRAGYSHWLGGQPQGGDPPTFDTVLDHLFHAFAPWSALVLLALGRMLWPADRQAEGENPTANDGENAPPFPEEPPLRLALVLWAAFAYGALTVFLSRYGLAPYAAVVALGGAIALLLRDVERSRQAWWATGVVTVVLGALIIRDFALYPGSPIEGLALENVQVPEEAFNPSRAWAAAVGLFAVCAFLGFGVAPSDRRPDLRAPYRWLRAQWRRGRGYKAWLVLGAVVLGLVLLFGLASWLLGTSLGVSTLFIRVGRKLAYLPVVLPLAVAAMQVIVYVFGWLGQWRLAPLLLAGLVVGGYASQGFLPSLSAHFSPREVYDTYNALAADDEPLGEFRVGSRAAAYYAQGDIEELSNPAGLVRFLTQGGRRWAVFPTDELPDIDRRFRSKTGRHLFVPDASSARVVLATNDPIEGKRNENFLEHSVLEEVPEVDHRVGAIFEDKIELVGYDLDLPQRGYVGAGQDFTVTWYWRVLERVPGSYKIFLHVDGQGLRLNGDHTPVDGKYPVRLWEEGDVVVDRQKLTVPGNYRSGVYTFYIGFFAGGRRLDVSEGPKDNDNRVPAGRLRIR